MESGRAENVDNTAILNGRASPGLDAHERRSGGNEAERRRNMNFQDDVPHIIGHCVQRMVKGETGFRKPCQYPRSVRVEKLGECTIIDDVVQLSMMPLKSENLKKEN